MAARADYATKKDLAGWRAETKKALEAHATKKDLEAFATKKDLEAFATKKDLEAFATKKDLEETNDRVRANGVLLERMDSKVDAVIELLGTLASKSDLAKLDARLPVKAPS